METNDQSLEILSNSEVRLASRSGFDIPKPIQFFFMIVAAFGISLIATESLMTNQAETIELDKIIHFTGYACLAIVLSLSLRPKLLCIAIILTGLGGVLIEYLQLFSGRSCDLKDMLANTIGLLVGTSIGVSARLCWNAVSREFNQAFSTKNLRTYRKGALILKEGQKVDHLMIIQSGRVEVSRSDWNRSFQYGKGGIIGMIAAIKDDFQYTTIQALEKTVLLNVPIEKLHRDAAKQEAPVSMVLDGMADALAQMAETIENAEEANSSK